MERQGLQINGKKQNKKLLQILIEKKVLSKVSMNLIYLIIILKKISSLLLLFYVIYLRGYNESNCFPTFLHKKETYYISLGCGWCQIARNKVRWTPRHFIYLELVKFLFLNRIMQPVWVKPRFCLLRSLKGPHCLIVNGPQNYYAKNDAAIRLKDCNWD